MVHGACMMHKYFSFTKNVIILFCLLCVGFCVCVVCFFFFFCALKKIGCFLYSCKQTVKKKTNTRNNQKKTNATPKNIMNNTKQIQKNLKNKLTSKHNECHSDHQRSFWFYILLQRTLSKICIDWLILFWLLLFSRVLLLAFVFFLFYTITTAVTLKHLWKSIRSSTGVWMLQLLLLCKQDKKSKRKQQYVRKQQQSEQNQSIKKM